MEINGILCRQIFEHNKSRHDFYVEESYVIPWMYPYLEPHGLIMKMHPEPIQLTGEAVRNDRDFWDWYTRRLMGNPRFLRDVVARKSFSKLRSAIAGLYAYRGLIDEAEYAFRQAIELYPLSPEANFRLADAFMRAAKYEEATALMEAFLEQDPRNDKAAEFLAQLRGLAASMARRAELEGLVATGRIEVRLALELADLYRRLGQMDAFDRLVGGLLSDTGMPVDVYVQIARMGAEMRRLDLVEPALTRALQRQPDDGLIAVDLAAAQVALRRTDAAFETLRAAVERGGEPVRARLRGDDRFDAVRGRPEFQRLVSPPAPARPLRLPGGLEGLIR